MAQGPAMHQELIDEFVAKLRAGAQENLVSVILYGSAADGEFHPQYSDLNLLCIVQDASFGALNRMAKAIEWWRKKRRHPPLLMTIKELKDTADLFSIELMDMKLRHRVVYGDDVLRDLRVPMHLHRQQLEYELREKLFLLRQHILLAGTNDKALWEAMLNSLSSFTTLFRHVLIELNEQAPRHSLQTVQELATRLNFETSAFVQLIDVRARKSDRKHFRAADIAAGYLAGIETVAAAVDAMQGPPARAGQ